MKARTLLAAAALALCILVSAPGASSQSATGDDARYDVVMNVLGSVFGLERSGPLNMADLFRGIEEADIAERAIVIWPSEAVDRANVRRLIDVLLAIKTRVEAFGRGDVSNVNLREMIQLVDQLVNQTSYEANAELWRVAVLARLGLYSFVNQYSAFSTGVDPAAEARALRTHPAFENSLAQQSLRLLEVEIAKGGGSWARADESTVQSLEFVRSQAARSGDERTANSAILDLASLIVIRSSGDANSYWVALRRDALPGLLSGLEAAPLHADQHRDYLRLRAEYAFLMGGDAARESGAWFDATVAATEASGQPLWTENRVLTAYLSGPAVGDTPSPREVFERQATVASLLSSTPLSFDAARTFDAGGFGGDRASSNRAEVRAGARLPPDREMFRALAADAVVTLVQGPTDWLIAVGRYDPAQANAQWSMHATGDTDFNPLQAEGARGTGSAFGEILQIAGSTEGTPMLASVAQNMFRITFDRDPEAPDRAIFDKFGFAIDAALGGVCGGDALNSNPQRVLVILPANLSFVPLHLAMGPNGKRLIECYEFSFAPDLATALTASERRLRARTPRTIRGVFNPTGDLPFAEAERVLIQASVGRRIRVQASSPERAREELFASRGGVVHIAAHGRVSFLAPLESGVQLGGTGGRFLVRDLLSGALTADVDLVVLSSCESGLAGTTFGPIAFYSLPGGFLHSGAGGVVSTLWQVRDDASALINARFYQNHVQRGMRPASALREAQLWLSRATRQELVEFVRTPEGEPYVPRLESRILRQAESTRDRPPYSDTRLWGGYAYFGAGRS